jgi:hypothetical protein
MEMADNLTLTKCRYFPDVVASLVGKNFNVVPMPYAKNYAPGVILCVDYDLGTDGIAYHDGYFELTTGLQNYHRWNEGNYYRNDGVDIGRCIDPSEPEFYVGWTQPGEWLEYTVNFNKARDDYMIRLRISKPTSNAKFQFFLDGLTASKIISISDIPGGEWVNVPAGSCTVDEGVHHLPLNIVDGGFDMNKIIIE